MPRHLALLLGSIAVASAFALPSVSRAATTAFVGPTQILLYDSDSVFVLASKEWVSASVRHQEKLLRHAIRMAYWKNHLPPDMRMVFDALGYPTGRMLLTPVGHSEEWWYYGQLRPPLRFRDGRLIDDSLFESLAGR